MTREPAFELAEDGEHFTFTHDCVPLPGPDGPVPFRRTDAMPHSGGTWKVVQREPLTVQPSIHCTACGTHGWIRSGRWVSV